MNGVAIVAGTEATNGLQPWGASRQSGSSYCHCRMSILPTTETHNERSVWQYCLKRTTSHWVTSCLRWTPTTLKETANLLGWNPHIFCIWICLSCLQGPVRTTTLRFAGCSDLLHRIWYENIDLDLIWASDQETHLTAKEVQWLANDHRIPITNRTTQKLLTWKV